MKGNGSIIQVPGGFRAFYAHNGKRISKRFKTKAEAADWLALNRADVALGDWVEPTGITLGQWILECIRYAAQRLKPSTINNYKAAARHLAPLANVKLQKLNGVMLQKVIDAAPTAPQRLGLYKFTATIIKRALKLQLIRKDLMVQVDAPRYSAPKKDVFTAAEIQRIFKALEGDRYQVFFRLAFASGARLGEMQGLKIQSVKDNCIRIENNISFGKDASPKTECSKRDITLPAALIAALKAEWENNKGELHGYIFTNNGHSPVSVPTLEQAWHRILKAAGVPYRNIHYIRHTHATLLLSEGVPILEVQHRLGHTSATTTLNRYGHILQENQSKIISTLEKLENVI